LTQINIRWISELDRDALGRDSGSI